MNNLVVMHAIAEKMKSDFDFLTNSKSKGNDFDKYIQEIKELYDAYFELRGHKGSVIFVQGIDTEVNNVKSIFELTCDIEYKNSMRFIVKNGEKEIGHFETIEQAKDAVQQYKITDEEDRICEKIKYEIYDKTMGNFV